MVKIFKKSTIEVWCTDYINNPKKRAEKDKDAVVVQLEASSTAKNYIVEVMRGNDYTLIPMTTGESEDK